MARNLSPGDIVACTLVCQDVEQVSLTTFHYICGIVAGGGATDADFALQFDTAMQGDIKLCINNNATYMGCFVQVVNPPPITRRQVNIINRGAGSAGGTAGPRQASGIVSLGTALAGRAQRGRVYVPFPATASMDTDGTPTALYVSRINSLVNSADGINIVTGAGSIAVGYCIYHRRFNTTDDITVVTAEKKWATQKRRGSFGRANVSPI